MKPSRLNKEIRSLSRKVNKLLGWARANAGYNAFHLPDEKKSPFNCSLKSD